MPEPPRLLASVLVPFLAAPALAQGSQPPDLAIRYEVEVTIHDEELIETVDLYLRPDKLPKQLQLELSGTMKVESVRHGQRDLHHLAKGSPTKPGSLPPGDQAGHPLPSCQTSSGLLGQEVPGLRN